MSHHVAVKHDAEKAVEVGPNQKWHYDAATGVITGFDGRILDVEGGNKAQGTKLIVYDKGAQIGPNQQWDYKDGYFITRMGTGFCIDINGGKIANGTDLILWTPAGGANQKWDIDHFGFIRSRANPNMCIDIAGGKPGKGLGKVHLWTASATPAQVSLAHKLKSSQNQRWHYDHKSGFITAYDGRVLDVEGGSKAQGAKVILWPKKHNDNINQQWDYKDGYFVTRMGTGFCIDINGGKVADGTDLILWTPAGGPNQKWDIDQYGYIRSRANVKFGIDVKNGAAPGKQNEGGVVHIWTIRDI